MTQLPLPPPNLTKDPQLDRWFVLLWKRINSAGQLLWSQLNFSGSDLADLERREYKDLQNIPARPVFFHDEGGDDFIPIPGPRGSQGEKGERGAFGMDGLDGEDLNYPTPYEGIRSSSTFQGITTENGFVERNDSTMSFDDSTRTFTISPVGASFEVWSYGNRITVTSPQSVQIADTEGSWAIYWDAFGVLSAQFGFDETLIIQKGWCCLLYWDATNNKCIFLGDERHGRTMDSRTHAYLHNSRHAVYQTGFGLSGFTADGSGALAEHAQFSCDNGVLWDEDIQHTITDGSPQDLSPIANIPVYYRSGAAGDWRRIAPSNFPLAYAQAGTLADWNEFTGGIWTLTEVTSHNFVLMHYFATNDASSNKIIGIVGQNTYSTIALARAGALTEIASLVTSGLPTLEFVAIGTVIFETSNTYSNTPKSRIRTTDTGENYIDWRSTTTVTIGGTPTVGPQGQTGPVGPAGQMMFIDPDIIEPMIIPGPKGEPGTSPNVAWILSFAAAHG